MNRFGRIAVQIATDQDDIIAAMSNLEHLHTDFGGMKLESKREQVQGDQVTFAVTFYFDKLVYVPSYIGGRLAKVGEAALMQAFEEVLKDVRGGILRKITSKLEKDPPLNRVVGWDKSDDYEDVTGKVQNFTFGKMYVKFGEVCIEGRVKMTVQARKLPELSAGVYDQMSDRELAEWVKRWANAAPENFWMDGEYRGSAAARIRDIMRQWRKMSPNQQNKHHTDLQKWT